MQINSELQQLRSTLKESPLEASEVLWEIVNRYVALDDSDGSTEDQLPAAA